MKVFVSGKVGDSEVVEELGKELRSLGHEITFDWTTIDHLRPYETNAEASTDAAELEIEGVRSAEVLVLVAHARGVGMYVELGAALALGKPVLALVSGEAPTMFLFHPQVRIYSDKKALVAALEEWQ
jgi:hypothetical protein